MEEVSIDDIDEPVLSLETAKVENARLTIHGYVDLQGGRLLYEEGSTARGLLDFLRPSSWVRVPLQLEVDRVDSFLVDNVEGLATLTIESILRRPGRLDIVGIFPGSITVLARFPESMRILISRDSVGRRWPRSGGRET